MICIAVLATFVSYTSASREKPSVDAWADAAKLILSHQGWVNKGFRGHDTQHGGFTFRGVVADYPMRPGNTVVEIPRSLWITLSSFPKFQDAPIKDTSDCQSANEKGDLAILKFAAALALETKKGKASKYNLYLQKLPTMKDFQQFHPLFAEDKVFSDFGGLHILDAVRERRQGDEVMQRCFTTWQSISESPAAGLNWSDVMLALMRIRTRNFDSSDYAAPDGSGVMVPALDLLNTERSDMVNAEYMIIRRNPEDIKHDVFKVKVVGNGVPAGGELYDEYCHGCDNSYMLFSWGIYLEDNRNKTWHYGAACEVPPHPSTNFESTNGTTSFLQRSAEDMLDLDDAAAARAAGWSAPRCQKDKVNSQKQGLLRCSLARLAWEECFEKWTKQKANKVVSSEKTSTAHAFLRHQINF